MYLSLQYLNGKGYFLLRRLVVVVVIVVFVVRSGIGIERHGYNSNNNHYYYVLPAGNFHLLSRLTARRLLLLLLLKRYLHTLGVCVCMRSSACTFQDLSVT